MSFNLAVIAPGAVESADQAWDLMQAMLDGLDGEPPDVILDVLAQLAACGAGPFTVDRPADSRGAIISTERPDRDVYEMLLLLAMGSGVAVYDPIPSRLYDPRGRVEIEVTLGATVALPYLTRDLLREMVLQPSWPDPECPFFTIVRAAEGPIEVNEFIQVNCADDGDYQLEHRDRSSDSQFVFHTHDSELVIEVMWAWTTQKTSWRTEVDWSPILLGGRTVHLQNGQQEDGVGVSLNAELKPDGSLEISGHGLGSVADAVSPDGESEFWYTVAAADVPAMTVALGGNPHIDILELLEHHCATDAGYNVGGAIQASGVKYDFRGYP